MGTGVQRGGALVAPALSRHVAARAAERSAILKEKRKFAEEVRLRKPGVKEGGKCHWEGEGRRCLGRRRLELLCAPRRPAGEPAGRPRAAYPGPGERGPGRHTQRDLLPPPSAPPRSTFLTAGLARGTRQRVSRRLRAAERCHEVVGALNLLMGCETNEFDPSEVQKDALHALETRLRERKPPADMLSPEEAGSALLGSSRPYDGGATNQMGSYDSARLSVPQIGSDPVDIFGRLPAGARNPLVAFEERILLNEEEWGEWCERQRPAPCYWDPKLRHDSVHHRDLVQRMHEGGLLCYVTEAKARVGALCVRKKNVRLRLVIDCRATNARFRPTPHLPMGTGAARADVMLGEGVQAWASQSDIKDYFYACALPSGLCPHFCVEPVPCSFVASLGGAVSPGGDSLDASRFHRLYPALKVFPMGWSWSFYFAQLLTSAEIERALKLPESCMLRDRVPAPVLEGEVVLALPYCDNLSVAATSAARADAARQA